MKKSIVAKLDQHYLNVGCAESGTASRGLLILCSFCCGIFGEEVLVMFVYPSFPKRFLNPLLALCNAFFYFSQTSKVH